MTKAKVLRSFGERRKGQVFKLRYEYAKELVQKGLVEMVNKRWSITEYMVIIDNLAGNC